MKQKFIGIFIIFLLMPLVLKAATPSELQTQIEEVNKNREALLVEQRKLEAELNRINAEATTLGSAVKSLDVTKKKLQADINVTQSKITSLKLKIQSLENTMNDKARQILVHRKAIANDLQTLSRYDSRSIVLDLLASAQFSDLWIDRTRLEDLNTRMGDEVDALRETRQALGQEKTQKEKVKEEQLDLRGQLSGQKSVVEENQKAKAQLLAETKNKESEYQKMLALNIARQKESEADLYRLEQELRITLDPSLYPESKHGVLSWPLDYVYITGRFGKSDCRIYPGADCFHNGVDFRATAGTPVKAMLAGTVEGAGNTDDQRGCYSYGRWILIRHDDGLSSIYAHLSASFVRPGQRLITGQNIGLSGGIPLAYGSGYSKGQHLHVGLFATQGVEIRQFTTSIGCQQVFVPIAKGRDAYLDPLAYLPSL